MTFLKGVAVTLYEKTNGGVDDFNAPIFVETEVTVNNVLVEPAANDAVVSELDLNGKHIAYVLHIPKGDTHIWTNTKVKLPSPWNVTLKTYGDCLIYDPNQTPLEWNKKVKTELYE